MLSTDLVGGSSFAGGFQSHFVLGKELERRESHLSNEKVSESKIHTKPCCVDNHVKKTTASLSS